MAKNMGAIIGVIDFALSKNDPILKSCGRGEKADAGHLKCSSKWSAGSSPAARTNYLTQIVQAPVLFCPIVEFP